MLIDLSSIIPTFNKDASLFLVYQSQKSVTTWAYSYVMPCNF